MRRSSLALLLLTACAATGCANVSPPAPAPAPGASAGPRPDHGSAAFPVVPGPAHEVLGTAGAKPSAAPPPPRPAPAPRVHRPAAPAKSRGRATPSAAPIPGGSSVCALGEAYGGWAPGSRAAVICRQQFGG